MDRYIIIEESQSAHCCFDYTVVDTHAGATKNDKGKHVYWNRTMCECFELEEAEEICKALNYIHNAKPNP